MTSSLSLGKKQIDPSCIESRDRYHQTDQPEQELKGGKKEGRRLAAGKEKHIDVYSPTKMGSYLHSKGGDEVLSAFLAEAQEGRLVEGGKKVRGLRRSAQLRGPVRDARL